jgi:adenosine deaminase
MKFAARLIALLAAVLSGAFAASPDPDAALNRKVAELRQNLPALYAFLYRMPKGADLHNHLSGAVYAESYIDAATALHYCVDKTVMALAAPPCKSGQPDAAETQTNNTLRNALIDSLSLRNFIAGPESGHDHFFAAFGKFGPGGSGQFIAEVVRRAAAQNESYMELMAVSGGAGAAELGDRTGFDNDFDATRRRLETGGLEGLVQSLRRRVDQLEQTRIHDLGCESPAPEPACRVQVRYIYQVSRETPKQQIFAQVIAGFELAEADPRVTAINFVQAEDGVISMRDYHLQMTIVDYAHRLYPGVHITLHAGELAPGLVPFEGLQSHIREAVELGHAERIGHGVDIMYERDPQGLLQEMRERHIAVEINVTSNDGILGVRGNQHPFPQYRKAGVPVMLSTDDEGINRSNLTTEFQRAVLAWGLSWTDLKQLIRNSLEYSFLPTDKKARLKADLEQRLKDFEQAERRALLE